MFRTSAGVLTKTVSYRYDVFDRRIAKDVDDNGDGVVDRGERFVYDGGDLVLKTDANGNVLNRYLHGPAYDQVFADEDALGEILWALADHQGTVRDWVEHDSTTDVTTVANHLDYDAFGNIVSQSDPSRVPQFGFTGQDWDADVGMYHYSDGTPGGRWYHPRLGRFAKPDEKGFGAGDANLYRYVGNSPVNYVDPDGMQEKPYIKSATPPELSTVDLVAPSWLFAKTIVNDAQSDPDFWPGMAQFGANSLNGMQDIGNSIGPWSLVYDPEDWDWSEDLFLKEHGNSHEWNKLGGGVLLGGGLVGPSAGLRGRLPNTCPQWPKNLRPRWPSFFRKRPAEPAPQPQLAPAPAAGRPPLRNPITGEPIEIVSPRQRVNQIDPAAPKPVRPSDATMGGTPFPTWGRDRIGWGTGPEGALDRMTTITRQDLLRQCVTREQLTAARDFYMAEFRQNAGNQSAAARVQLMEHILTLLP